MKMVSNKEYIAGWLDSSVHDFLEVISPDETSTKYALITCIDSNRDPSSMLHKSPELKGIAGRCQVLGTSLLLPTEWMLHADSQRQIFFGFDEIWFFPNKDIEPKPASATMVGPPRIDRSRFTKLVKWMSRNSCSMALGSGEGLNFIVKAHGVVRYLLGHSMDQPQHSLAAL